MKPLQDSFTDHVFRRMDPEVRDNLTPRQREAITDALRKSGPRDHAVDLRFTLNLIFTRIYVVFLSGRDRRRASAKESARARIGFSKVLQSLFLLSVFGIPAFLVLFFLLYLLKSALGIDIFEDKHLMDFLR